MHLEWDEVADNGSCPILSYSIFRDDGVSGEPTIEINQANDPLVRNIPTISAIEVQLSEADLGT